jgi:hypothetical protein
VVIDRQSHLIISTCLFNGNAHNGTIFRATTPVHPDIVILCGSGYRGLQKYHRNTLMPIRHKEDIARLSESEKASRKERNKAISSVRMKVEHIIGRVKNFKIVAEKYRNKIKRLIMRFNLICGIINYEKINKI